MRFFDFFNKRTENKSETEKQLTAQNSEAESKDKDSNVSEDKIEELTELNTMLKSVKGANFFQAFDRKFVFIPCNNKFIKEAKEFFKFESDDNGLLVYGYIDESGEAVFRVLAMGNIRNNKLNITVIAPLSKMAMRRIEINDFKFLSLDYCEFDTSIYEGVVREIADKHYNTPSIEAVRGLRFIDSLRSKRYPDNIIVFVECEDKIIDKFSIRCVSILNKSEIVGIVSTEPTREYVRISDPVNVKMTNLNKTSPACIYSVSKAEFESAKQNSGMGLPVFYSGYYRWQEADANISVNVPIGKNVFGEGYYFDAKYGKGGINVLITGCPGSGKTEALYTWILSMAMCYSPKDVSFVIFGGLSGELNKLPHMANVIHWVQAKERVLERVTKQLRSEIYKRQVIINKQGCCSIMDYNEICKNNPQLEKLPYLYVVLDDIDSIMHLKSSENFLALIRSRTRVLGIQFICTASSGSLLSQNILSHFDSKWHMGSCNYFGVELKSPGNAIINGENVQLFYTGALSAFSNPIHYNKKQRSATMQAIWSCATSNNYSKNKPIITDFLPEKIDFEDVISKWEKDDERFAVPFGIADDVKECKFPVAFADFAKNGHMAIFGENGSGKTSLLQTIITSICELYSEEETRVFVLDFDMGAMKVFQKSTNVIDVAYVSEEEKVKGIIKRLETELNDRKEIFDNAGVGSLNEYKNSTGGKLPYIVLAIDNFAPLFSLCPETEKDILDIARYGAACGIYLILTASTPSELTYKIKIFAEKNSIALHMADRTEYLGIVGKTEGLEPDAVAGRGLIKLGKKILEFQGAYIIPEDKEN